MPGGIAFAPPADNYSGLSVYRCGRTFDPVCPDRSPGGRSSLKLAGNRSRTIRLSDVSVKMRLTRAIWQGRVHIGLMRIRHLDMVPSVHPEAYVAPTAVLSGEVRVGRGSCIMHGAVVAAEGGPVEIGANCMIMENAVLRGTPQHPLIMGDHVLAGPHSHLTGCGIADEVFIATGARVFNGAQMGRASSVALGGTVHIGCVVAPLARIPIGWVAVGEPARMYPPGDAEEIRAAMGEISGFLPFVFGIDEAADRREQMQAALRRYTAAIARHHRQDEVIPASTGDG